MITQYEALAEIEAMKVARLRRPGKTAAPPSPAATPASSWSNSSEQAIRAEMERRLVRRATTVSAPESLG